MSLKQSDIVIQLQNFHEVLARTSDPKVRHRWKEDDKLKDTLQRFTDMMPRSGTRSGYLQDAAQFVRAHPSDPAAWLTYFNDPPFFNDMLPCMRGYAKRGERTEPVFDIHPPPKIPAEVLKDARAAVAQRDYGSSEAKVQELRARSDLIESKLFGSAIPKEQIERNKFVCSKCGTRGHSKSRTDSNRAGDEPGTDRTMCEACGHRSKQSG